MDKVLRISLFVFMAWGAGAALTRAAHATDASAWSDDTRSAMRLIAGRNAKDAPRLRAGIEIKMQPGWHTYWRYPGDAGVPPRFDFSGSENVETAKVLYPAPQVHSDAGGQALGYENDVVFPVQVTPKDAGKPVKLRLKIDYAVCEKLCVPVEGAAELALTPGDSGQDAALQAAEARVPRPVPAADLGLTAHRVAGGKKPLVMLELAPPGGGPVQVFAEGPTPEWALPIPQPAQDAPAGRQHFSFALDGLPGGVDPKGAFTLTFTVVAGEKAYEVTTRLD
jgi:DsbC/DsbD-like thiol-disulfide interchange protein